MLIVIVVIHQAENKAICIILLFSFRISPILNLQDTAMSEYSRTENPNEIQ